LRGVGGSQDGLGPVSKLISIISFFKKSSENTENEESDGRILEIIFKKEINKILKEL